MSNRIKDAKHQPLSKVDRLRQDANAAAELRALTMNPNVIALRVESIRSQVDALMWVGIVLGLAFTMVNVQTFAAAGAAAWSLPWLAAWFLDPMVSLVLIAVLRAEQITARYQVETGVWVRRTKRFAFAATYLMNTWKSWVLLSPAGIVLHSVPPALVYLAAETGPILRDRLTEAVLRAERSAPPAAAMNPGTNDAAGVHGAAGAVFANAATSVQDTTGEHRSRTARPRSRPGRQTHANAPRKLFADYLAEARAAWSPGTVVTPAWVREHVDCSRGTSKKVADALTDEIHNGHGEAAA